MIMENPTIEYKEQEIQRLSEEVRRERIREMAPLLYDDLLSRGFVFEKPDWAFKPMNEDIEMSVWFVKKDYLDIAFYDRKKGRIGATGCFNRHEISPRLFINESKALEFVKNPILPKSYKVTFTYSEVKYFNYDNVDDVKSEARTWIESGWCPSYDITVDELEG